VTNADLNASGGYTVTAPNGEPISKIEFEAGSQSSFKIGISSISAVQYDVDFDMQLGYTITDIDGDSASGSVNISLDSNNTMLGTAGNDVLIGGAGNDVISGGAGNDLIQGGAGNDTLTGGLGADVFKWTLADAGTTSAPAHDVITDFNVASPASGGDILDLRDLLVNENAGNLTNYLHFEKSGSDTIIHISSTGAYSGGFNAAQDVQVILLQGVDLVGSGNTDQQIIQNLLDNQKLITD
jgi:Ca2+-binding RTX toxin-like protein